MFNLYGFVVILFVTLGIVRLNSDPAGAIYDFLIALFFLLFFWALKGKPFSKGMYLFIALCFLANSGLQFYFENIWNGVFSLIFSFLAFRILIDLRST
ncbi:hypothetical protein [Numidum massiliense]|uniref:hypothetical protein n=1 Tax=Numidum massiliense TaxID=1522315 RepID=UPI0006D53045|nr:hypothetical protein [Numidum massiliense]